MVAENVHTDNIPCGCILTTAVVDGLKTLTYIACGKNCEYFKYMVEESERQGKPVEFRDHL